MSQRCARFADVYKRQSQEASVIRTYLDTCLDLPWDTRTEDNLDVNKAAALLDMLFQPVERAAADKQDVFRVNLNELLLWMLPSALGRHIADSALQDLQQRCV